MKRLVKYLGLGMAALVLLLLFAYLVFQLTGDETRKDWSIALIQTLTGRELTINGEFHLDVGSELSLVAGDIVLSNADWGSYPALLRAARIESGIKLWPLLLGVVDFRLNAQTPELFLETDALGRTNWMFGNAGSVDDSTESQLWEVKGSMEIADAVFEFRNGQTGRSDHAEIRQLAITAREEQFRLALDGHFNKLPLTVESDTDVSESAKGVKPIALRGVLGRLNWDAKGTFGEADEQLDLAVSLETPTLRIIDGELGSYLPDLGPAHGQGRISGALGELALGDLDIRLEDKVATVGVTGSLDNIARLSGFSLSFNLTTKALPQAIKRTVLESGFVLPSEISGRGKITGDWGRGGLSLTDLETRLGTSLAADTAQISVTGQIKDLLALDGVDLSASLETSSLAYLSHYLPPDLPELPRLGPVKASWDVHSEERIYGVSKIRATVQNKTQNLLLTGYINDFFNFTGVDLLMEGSLQDLSQAIASLPAGVSGLGPVEVKASMQDRPGGSGKLVLASSIVGKKLSWTGSGVINPSDPKQGMAFDLELVAERLSDVGQLLAVELPETGPLKARATLGSTANRISLDPIAVTLGNSDLSGKLSYVIGRTGENVEGTLKGRLRSRMLDLTDILPKHQVELRVVEDQNEVSNSEDAPPLTEAEKKQKDSDILDHQNEVAENNSLADRTGDKVFSSDPLPLNLIRSTRINLDYAAERVKARYFDWEKLQAGIKLEQGVFTVAPFQATVGGQPALFKLVIDGSGSPLNLSLDYDADNVDISKLTTDLGTEFQGGEVDMHIHVTAAGDSPAALMAGLNGTAAAGLKGSLIPNAAVHKMGESLLDQINPQSTRQEQSILLECFAVYFEFSDGIATTPRGLVAKLPNVTWLGNGQIDLQTERLQISFAPKARKGLGISLRSLASLLLLGGTLKEPVLNINPTGVVGASASYAAAISTGGLSLLFTGLLDKQHANEAVCERVLEQIVEEPASTEDVKRGAREKRESVLDKISVH